MIIPFKSLNMCKPQLIICPFGFEWDLDSWWFLAFCRDPRDPSAWCEEARTSAWLSGGVELVPGTTMHHRGSPHPLRVQPHALKLQFDAKRWDGAPNLRFQPIPPSFHHSVVFWQQLDVSHHFSPFLTISHLHHETPREAHCVEGHPPSSQGPLSLLPQTASAPLDPPRIGQGLTVNRHQHTLEFAHPNTQKYHENIWNLQIQPPQNDGIQQKIGSGDPKMNEYTTKTSISVGLVYIIWREGISIPNLDKDDKAEICMKSEETICFTLQKQEGSWQPNDSIRLQQAWQLPTSYAASQPEELSWPEPAQRVSGEWQPGTWTTRKFTGNQQHTFLPTELRDSL